MRLDDYDDFLDRDFDTELNKLYKELEGKYSNLKNDYSNILIDFT